MCTELLKEQLEAIEFLERDLKKIVQLNVSEKVFLREQYQALLNDKAALQKDVIYLSTRVNSAE